MKRFPTFAAGTFVLTTLLFSVSGTVFGAGLFSVYLPLTQSSKATNQPPPTTGPTAQPTTEPTAEPTVEPTAPKTFFLPFEIGGVNNTTDASIALDPAGGVHVSYGTIPYTYAIYGYCAANCTDQSKFSAVRFGGTEDNQRIYDVMLALDPVGHPRMLWNTNAGWQYAACDAHCTNAASWTATVIAPAGGTEHSQRFVIDKQGRAHLIDYGAQYESLYETHYITCAANCTDAANWTRTQISPAAYSKPALAVTAAGQLRIVFQTYDFGDDRFATHDNRLGYAACDTNCTDAANWSTMLRFDEVDQYDGSWALVLDPQERPRVALAPWRPYGSDTAESQLYYMWCNAACNDAAGSWATTRLTTPEEEVSAVDLALDSANRPQMSFSFSSNQDGVAYGIYHGRCLTSCESDDGSWEFNLIDSIAALNESDPVNDTGICSNPTRPTWSLGGTSALALDNAGKAQVAYDARHLWTCYSNGNIKVQRDINWARYAPAR